MIETKNRTEFDSPPVLVVEDDPDYRDLVADALARDGHTVVSASNGAEAMDYIDRSIETPCGRGIPAVVITDIRMPEVGGFDLLAYAGFVPTIVMTAFGTAWTHREARRLGARQVFDKPFNLAELRATVNDLVDESIDERHVTPSPPRLLIADDDRDFVAYMRDLFVARTGATVVTAFSGVEALEALAEQGPFDLVLTDHRMPGPDGAQLVTMARYAGFHGPMLIVTAFPGEQTDRAVELHDSVRLIPKAANPRQLMATAVKLINESRSSRQSS